MSDLVTLLKVKEHLRIKDASQDSVLSFLITACSKLIETWMNRVLSVNNYKDRFNGTGLSFHYFRNNPIISILSLKVDDNLITDFEIDNDQVYLINNYFNRGKYNCIIEYSAGFQTIPEDIENACLEFVSFKYRQKEHIDLSSKGMAGETTSYIVKDIPDFIKVVLQHYKNIVPL